MDNSVPAGAALVLDFIYRTDAEKAPPDCHQVILGNRQSQLSVIPCGVGDAKRGRISHEKDSCLGCPSCR